jgi:hypothetical protein
VRSRDDGAVEVDTILEESEAYRRGLREGDEIVSFAGRPIRSVNQYKNILGIYPKGWKLPLEFRRDQAKATIFVRLRGLHSRAELVPGQKQPDPDDKRIQPPKPKGPEPPAAYAHMLVKQDGYANLYFNNLEQQRVLNGLTDWGDYSGRNGVWQLSGKDATGLPFSATISPEKVELNWQGKAVAQSFDGSPIQNLPEGSGGLLVALQHLRLFLTQHGFLFSEFAYLGSEPLDGRGAPADVLTSELTGVQSRWYFSRSSGEFVGFDTQLSEDLDECEVRFGSLADFQGLNFPSQLIVHNGGREVTAFTIETFKAGEGPRPSGTKDSKTE